MIIASCVVSLHVDDRSAYCFTYIRVLVGICRSDKSNFGDSLVLFISDSKYKVREQAASEAFAFPLVVIVGAVALHDTL